jgi:methylmalonyl-CoA mutase N-terminal domain/subunit
MIGVNSHVQDEAEDPHIHRADPETEREQIGRIRDLRARRDPTRHEAALGALRTACEGTENVMPHLFECARARATMGEICDVLRSVWGRYRDPARW